MLIRTLKRFKGKTKEEKIKLAAHYFAKWRARTGRGNMWTSEFKGIFVLAGAGSGIILLIKEITGFLIPWWILIVIWIGQKVAEYFIGRFDEKYLKFWQVENVYLTEQVNPFYKDMMDRIKDIQNKLHDDTRDT